MIINRLNQLYKPKRTLYYIDASKEDLEAFYKGVVPPVVEKYADSFGAYDYPGVFFLRNFFAVAFDSDADRYIKDRQEFCRQDCR